MPRLLARCTHRAAACAKPSLQRTAGARARSEPALAETGRRRRGAEATAAAAAQARSGTDCIAAHRPRSAAQRWTWRAGLRDDVAAENKVVVATAFVLSASAFFDQERSVQRSAR
jgi:hypothetical protein